mmetsp:Transcript_49708/g.79134  ORF Transcript_49708/g.79134 Transcript_49708/m.79134 type:complete len:347 (+) Transcript_49708:217-1257(+)
MYMLPGPALTPALKAFQGLENSEFSSGVCKSFLNLTMEHGALKCGGGHVFAGHQKEAKDCSESLETGVALKEGMFSTILHLWPNLPGRIETHQWSAGELGLKQSSILGVTAKHVRPPSVAGEQQRPQDGLAPFRGRLCGALHAAGHGLLGRFHAAREGTRHGEQRRVAGDRQGPDAPAVRHGAAALRHHPAAHDHTAHDGGLGVGFLDFGDHPCGGGAAIRVVDHHHLRSRLQVQQLVQLILRRRLCSWCASFRGAVTSLCLILIRAQIFLIFIFHVRVRVLLIAGAVGALGALGQDVIGSSLGLRKGGGQQGHFASLKAVATIQRGLARKALAVGRIFGEPGALK